MNRFLESVCWQKGISVSDYGVMFAELQTKEAKSYRRLEFFYMPALWRRLRIVKRHLLSEKIRKKKVPRCMTQVRVWSMQKLGAGLFVRHQQPVRKSREKGQQRSNDTLLAGLPVFALRLLPGVGSPLVSAATVAFFLSSFFSRQVFLLTSSKSSYCRPAEYESRF